MAQLLLHLGYAGGGRLTALLLSRDEVGAPRALLRDLATGRTLPVRLEDHASPSLRALLLARGVRARRLVATGLSDGGAFELEASAEGATTVRARARALPSRLPAAGLTMAAASCFFHGFPHHRRLAQALATRRLGEPASLMLLLGDNLYLDVLDGGGFIEGTPEAVVDRYLDHLLDTAVAAARSVVPLLTTWDDHEFWNDYPDSQPWLGFTRAARREAFTRAAADCLDAFAASLNPPGIRRSYALSLDGESPSLPGLSLFVADARTERSPSDARPPTMMPRDAFDALLRWARGLDRPGVLVIGQPLWIEGECKTLGLFTGDHNPPFFAEQYRALLDALRDAPWETLIVTGDVHYSRLGQIVLGGHPRGDRYVYELITSALSHLPGYGATLLRQVFRRAGMPQVSSEVEDPERIPYPASLRTLLATTVPNTFALLRALPVAGGVRVAVAFEDLATLGRAAPVRRLGDRDDGPLVPGDNAAPLGLSITLRRR